MNMKKFFLSCLAGFTGMFTLSGLWYMVIMREFYASQNASIMHDPVSIFPFILLGYAVLSLIMAYMYPLGYKGGTPAKEGLRFGILVGLLLVSLNLTLQGVYILTTSSTIVDSLYHLVEQGLGGVLIALVYGKLATE